MEVSLFKLSSVGVMQIDQIVEFGNIEDKQIKGLKDVFVKGIIKYNVLEEIELNLDVKGTMIINDSITLEEIPYDYDGTMGVPDTILGQLNPEQFEIIGLGSGDLAKLAGVTKNYRGRTDLAYTVGGKHKCPYSRILIRKKQ